MHDINIIIDKLRRLGISYPAIETASSELSRSAVNGDNYYQQTLLNSTLLNGPEVHEVLENVQETAVDWDENGTNLTDPQKCAVLINFKNTVDSLL